MALELPELQEDTYFSFNGGGGGYNNGGYGGGFGGGYGGGRNFD